MIMQLFLKSAFALIVLFFLFPNQTHGQVNEKWQIELSSDILWQEVTALGNLIVSTKNQLVGLDTETGSINWAKQDLAGISREFFQELPNSPFFTATSNNQILVFDEFSGDKVFDSNNAGISIIDDYYLLYNSDAILVSGKGPVGEPIMVSVKMSTGKVNWLMNEKFGRIVAVTELGNNELLVVTLFNNYKLNANTGDVIWKDVTSADVAKLDKMGALGSLLKAAAETLSEDMDFDLRFYKPEGSDVFYLGSEKESQSSMSSSSGEPMISYTNNYYAYNISDGSLAWPNPLEVKGKLSQVMFMESGILILPDNGNRTRINLFDYNTQEGKWGKKGKGIIIKGGIYDYLETGNGILLVTQTSNKNFLNFLNPESGVVTFDKPVKVEGRVIGIVPLDLNILFITTEEMNILDPVSGILKWKKSIQTNTQLTGSLEGKIYVFDSKSKTLKVVDESTGVVSEMSSFQLKFNGGETPRKLEIMDDGLFIYSDQNVSKFDFNGTLKFQEYYPAPREPTWKRALLYAEAIRGAYISASAYYVSGALVASEDDVREEDPLAGEIVSQLGDAYGELGDQASQYASTAFKMANQRHKATLSTRDYMLVMAKREKNIELLKVSKSTGRVEQTINLGKDREPIYAIDDITGLVYYKTDDTIITCYDLNQ